MLFRILHFISYCFKKIIYRCKWGSFFYLKKGLRYIQFSAIHIGKWSDIIIENEGSIDFLGRFYCRNFAIIKANGGKISIGDNVFFNNSCSITCRSSISIGDDCLLGEGVKIYDHDHVFKFNSLISEQGYKVKSISIGKDVWIGSNVVILKGTVIGDHSVIAAGTILSGQYPENSLVTSARDNKITLISKH